MIDIMGMMFAHSYDIFLIDWERPSGEGKISTWRRILIAKEWVELQVNGKDSGRKCKLGDSSKYWCIIYN